MQLSQPLTTQMQELILASSSPYRKALLNRLHLAFNCCAPGIDEQAYDNEGALQLVRRLAEAKARKIGTTHQHHLIIGSDQVAEHNNTIITKPGSFAVARQQLLTQSGNAVKFHTGLCLYNSDTDTMELDVITTTAHFRTLTEEEIERYLYIEQPFDCAGSFKSELLGASLLNSMTGPDPTALVGLPLIRLAEMLRNQGIKCP